MDDSNSIGPVVIEGDFAMNATTSEASQSISPNSASSSSSTPVNKSCRTGKKHTQLSEVWKHYDMNEHELSVTCRHCNRKMKRTDSSTKSMWGHLGSFHLNDVQPGTFERKRKRCVKPKAIGTVVGDLLSENSKDKTKGIKRKRVISSKSQQKSTNGTVSGNIPSINMDMIMNQANLTGLFPPGQLFPPFVTSAPNIYDIIGNNGTEINASTSISPNRFVEEKVADEIKAGGAERNHQLPFEANITLTDQTALLDMLAAFKFEKPDEVISSDLLSSVTNITEANDFGLALQALFAMLGTDMTSLPPHVLEAAYQLFTGSQQLANTASPPTNINTSASVDCAPKLDVNNQHEKVGDFLKKQLQNGQSKAQSNSSAISALFSPPTTTAAASNMPTSVKLEAKVTMSDDERSFSTPTINRALTIESLQLDSKSESVMCDTVEVSRPSSSSLSSCPSSAQLPIISLQSPESLLAMHRIAVDLNLVYTMRLRSDGTPEFNFDRNTARNNNNDNASETKESVKQVTLTETADKMLITEHDDVNSETEEWYKSSVTQLMWAVRGKCQKCFYA